jgi:hypothetical protein
MWENTLMKMRTNPAINGLWAPFNRKFSSALRTLRRRFVPDDEFTCNPPVVAKVTREAVEGGGIPVKSTVQVVQVGPPQISKDYIWRRVRRPYVSATVIYRGEQRQCNLESLKPV